MAEQGLHFFPQDAITPASLVEECGAILRGRFERQPQNLLDAGPAFPFFVHQHRISIAGRIT